MRYHVSRSITINASPEDVFETVADYSRWTLWSPWLCAEPDAHVHVTDDPASVGSVYSWKGEIVGEGEIEHRRLDPGRTVEDEIRFVKPFRSQSKVVFDMKPDSRGTGLAWHIYGSLPWFMFWMRSQLEIVIGMDYERGLKMLKEYIETGVIRSKTIIRGVQPVGPLRLAGIRKQCSMSDIGPSMQSAFAEATGKLARHGLPTDREWLSVYHKFDVKRRVVDYTSGCVVPEAVEVPADLSSWSLPATKALCVEHIGSYEHLGNAWSAAYQVARSKKLKQSSVGAFEVYKNSPETTPPAELSTEIYLPLRS